MIDFEDHPLMVTTLVMAAYTAIITVAVLVLMTAVKHLFF